MPRQKQVLQENPILSKASPNINCTLYGRTAQSPKMKGLPPKQPKFSSFLPQPTSMLSGGSHGQRGGAGGALDPESQAGRSG